ncbi:MAG TPA: hypothetical protein VIV40_12005 [Kofleriaceae bacterium]
MSVTVMKGIKMKNLFLALGLASISLIGCGTDGSSGPEVLPDLTVPKVPDNGVQVLTPIFDDIQPGTDNEVCTWTDVVLDKQVDVKSTLGYQNEPPGHHAILFYTLEKQPPGTQRICTDTDMASFRYLTGNGNNGAINEAPGDLVFRIPAGAQLVVNSHYLNAGDEVLRGQSVINVNFADASPHTPSGSLAIVDTQLQVAQGVTTQNMHCTFDRNYKLWYLIPHMHRWGKHINVDLTLSGEKQRMFDLDWEEQYTFHPPENRYPTTEPFQVHAGDSIDVSCEWNNTENRVLPFGFEMCVTFGQFIDESGLGGYACDHGSWTTF